MVVILIVNDLEFQFCSNVNITFTFTDYILIILTFYSTLFYSTILFVDFFYFFSVIIIDILNIYTNIFYYYGNIFFL